jgi:uncharacterized protein YhfF
LHDDLRTARENQPTIDKYSGRRFPIQNNPSLADQLLALVLEGKKRATCWAVSEGLKGAAVGKSMVALDSKGRPRVVLTTRELVQRRFNDVDDDFGYDEGR